MLALYQFAFLATSIISFVLGIFVVTQNKKSAINVSWFALSIAMFVFCLFFYLQIGCRSERTAFLFGKLLALGAIPASPLFFLFVTHLTYSYWKHRRLVWGLFAICCIFWGSILTNDFFKGAVPLSYFTHYALPGMAFPYYLVFFSFNVIYSHYILITQLFNSSGNQKTKIKYMLLSSVVGFLGGAGTFFPLYGVSSLAFLTVLLPVYPLIITFAIVRHQLMDISVIIKRTLVFAGLLAFVFAIYASVTLFVRNVLNDFFYVRPIWSNLISIFLVVLGYDPLRSFLINLTDKHLFQKGYDYHKVLKDASKGMSKIENLKHLLGLVLHFVTMKMRVENAAVFSFDMSERVYRIVASRGFKVSPRISLSSDHSLIRMLNLTNEAIRLDEAREHALHPENKQMGRDYQIISEELNLLGAECAIPSFLGRDLKNILLIGRKKSGEGYTTEDISLLMTLAQESAIAIENARLYDEAIKKQKQLGQINEQLEHSKKMLVTALAQAEGANKQLQDTQAQLIHEQKMATLGRLAASVGHEVNNPLTILSMNVSRAILKYRKNPDLKVSEILDVFDKMEKNIERIKAVVNTLTGLLKKSEKGKFEPLSLKLILEETLPLVQFQTYMDNLSGTEVELNVPGNIPLIRADLERLQEIFLNLFINAYHAMANKRFRKIRVDAEIDPDDRTMVAVHFTDNGSGMTEEIMKKIFNYGFTTKPPGKGSGMGLYMCKYIVELHGGTIRVKSKVGEGTTFTVTVPIYQDEQTVAGGRTPSPPEGPKSSVA